MSRELREVPKYLVLTRRKAVVFLHVSVDPDPRVQIRGRQEQHAALRGAAESRPGAAIGRVLPRPVRIIHACDRDRRTPRRTQRRRQRPRSIAPAQDQIRGRVGHQCRITRGCCHRQTRRRRRRISNGETQRTRILILVDALVGNITDRRRCDVLSKDRSLP